MIAEHAARVQEHFDVVKLLVTRGASFHVIRPYLPSRHSHTFTSSEHTIQSGLNICFGVEMMMTNLPISKYLLRNGASADFADLYQIIAHTANSLECVKTSFLKLVLLATW